MGTSVMINAGWYEPQPAVAFEQREVLEMRVRIADDEVEDHQAKEPPKVDQRARNGA